MHKPPQQGRPAVRVLRASPRAKLLALKLVRALRAKPKAFPLTMPLPLKERENSSRPTCP